jgi:Skp family chaperone for outer membrane proteins
MKKSIFCFFIHLSIANTILNAMENSPLTRKEIERLAELMQPISEGEVLTKEDSKEFSELYSKIRSELKKRKKELKKQTNKSNDLTDKQEK